MGNRLVGERKHFSSIRVLDEIVSESTDEPQSLIYTLANYRKGGIFVDTYHQMGLEGVKRLAKELLPKYILENNNYSESGKNQICIPLETQNITSTCWKLDKRGLLGETLIHILTLCNTAIHTSIARCLLELYPNMALDVIVGEEYFGATALHLSIAYQNTELTELLLRSGANVHQRATGRFFQPTDQQLSVPKKQTDFQGLFYMGEYPLAWAACCEDETTYNLLLKYGADPNETDTYGNIILHVIVVRDKQTMYGYALKHPTAPAKDDSVNNYGLTPLALCCKLGRNKIFREILELRSFEFWRYSTITCSGYPLNALDSLLPTGKTNWNSAIIIILSGKTNEHLDMLDGSVIQRLVEEKWKTFARRQFLKRLALILIHLITLSVAVFLRNEVGTPLLTSTDTRSICRYCAEIGTCVGCIGFVIFQPAEEILAQGTTAFLINLSSNPPKAVFIISSLLILFCVPCRLIGDRITEDILLAIALPGSWFILMFFAGAVRLTGPFVTMIYSILSGDMFRFCIIYFTFLLAFTQAFYFLFKNQPSTIKSKRFQTYPKTWISLFQMTLGNYEYEEFRRTYYLYFTQIVLAIFLVFMPILLLNMLIAMMGNTYCQVIEQSEREWMKQWAKIVIALERAISHKKAREYMETYSIPSTSSEDPNNQQRAVMVIRRKLKSKAKQRKGALINWKRIGRKVIFQLKRNVKKTIIKSTHQLECSNKDAVATLNQITLNSIQTDKTTTVLETLSNLVNISSLTEPHLSANHPDVPSCGTCTQEVTSQEGLVSSGNKEISKHLSAKEENKSSLSESKSSIHQKEKTKRRKRKKRFFRRAKVGTMQENKLSESDSEKSDWTIGVKVGRRRPKSVQKSKHPRNNNVECNKNKRKFTKRRGTDLCQSTSLKLDSDTLSIKQKRLAHWSTKNILAMTSLVAWDKSSDDTHS